MDHHHTAATGEPPVWAAAVAHHTTRLKAEGVPDPQGTAITLVDATMIERAYQDDVLIGPTHFSNVDGDLACGMVRGTPGAQSTTDRPAQVRCDGCNAEIDQLMFTGSIPADPDELTRAGERVGERYLTRVLGVPPWALPAGTQGTPLHPFSVHVRGLATRVVRLTLRLGVALEAAQGQAERARATIDGGGLPSWTMLEPEPMLETAASAEALRLLTRSLADTAAALVATCTQVDRWLKAEAPGVTGDPAGVDLVLALAGDWRDLQRMSTTSRTTRNAQAHLIEAVDAYRRTLTPTVTMLSGED